MNDTASTPVVPDAAPAASRDGETGGRHSAEHDKT